MTLLRDTAVQKLQVAHPRLNPVKQIAIARKYHCDVLVDEPFETLAVQEEVLSREEMAQLPLEDLHGLFVKREARLQQEKAEARLQQEQEKARLQQEKVNALFGQCGHCARALQLSTGYCGICQKCNSCGFVRRIR